MKILTELDLKYIIEGSSFLGSGGGGRKNSGYKLLEAIQKLENQPLLKESSYNNDRGIVIADFGKSDSWDKNQIKAIQNAYNSAKEYYNQGNNFDFLAPIETGAENSLSPLYLSALYGIPCLDGDSCGRAVPTLDFSTYISYSILPFPCFIANGEGDIMMVDSQDASKFEKLIRPLTGPSAMGVSLSLAFFPMTGKQWMESAIKGTISFAKETGGSLIAKKIPADFKFLAKGKLFDLSLSETTGFDFGYYRLESENTIYTVYEQNESLLMYSSQSQSILEKAPYSICCLDENMESVTNAELKIGEVYSFYSYANEQYLKDTQIVKNYKNFVIKLGYGGL